MDAHGKFGEHDKRLRVAQGAAGQIGFLHVMLNIHSAVQSPFFPFIFNFFAHMHKCQFSNNRKQSVIN